MGEGTKICSYYCTVVCDSVSACSADTSFAADTTISLANRSTLLSKISSLLSTWGRSFSSPTTPAAAAKAMASDWNAIDTAVGNSFGYNSISTYTTLGTCTSFSPSTYCSDVSRPAGTVDITMSAASAGSTVINSSISNITTYANKLNSAPRCSTYSATRAFNTICSNYCSCVDYCGCDGYCSSDCACIGYCSIDSCGIV